MECRAPRAWVGLMLEGCAVAAAPDLAGADISQDLPGAVC
jgi:hypothetical protein